MVDSKVAKIRIHSTTNSKEQREIVINPPRDSTNLYSWVEQNFPGWTLQLSFDEQGRIR